MNKLLNPPGLFRHWATLVSCATLAAVLARAGERQDTVAGLGSDPLRVIHKHFFPQTLLPPVSGLYVQPEAQTVAFANGLLLRNPAHRLFTAGVTPPGPGASVTHAFGSQVEMEVSTDGGSTWTPYVASGATQVHIVNSGPSGGDTLYATEMLALDISGGTLPGTVRIRESPTKASTGETRIETIPGGYMIDSFFDIWPEVSMDAGSIWFAALQPVSMELKVDPALIPAVAAPRPAEPMPNGQYVSTQPTWQAYANGIVLRDVRDKRFTLWMDPPLLGGSQTYTFDSQLDLQLSTDGGLNWQLVRAPGMMSLSTKNVREFSGETTEEEVVTQLNISGGDLPVGVLIRESPTKVSEGGTARTAGGGGGAGGGYMVSSFFDIFTEVSTDSGITWSVATNGPAHMELKRVAPVHELTSNLLPPPQGEYAGTRPRFAFFANNIVISNFVHRAFVSSIPPPPPGSVVTHTCGSTVEMDIFIPGGGGWSHVSAPATSTLQIAGLLGGAGGTEYFDTEMIQMDLSSGSPANVLIRESPTKASLGRTTITDTGLGVYDCDSFFDIFIEISVDGGNSWYPTLAGPGTVTLNPLGQTFDFGDAPDPKYPTLLSSNGARHKLSPLFLGLLIDAEFDGQPTPGANGDDLNGLADEDGIALLGMPWIPNCSGAINCISSGPGFLDAWVDFNKDGDWSDAGEQILGSVPVAAGVNGLIFNVPGNALAGVTYARFRLSSTGGLSFTGPAPDGEVEDYLVSIGEPLLDFGDAPDSVNTPGYPTLLAHNGARHYLRGTLYLGTLIDSEANGQPTPAADGDDIAGLDDEDGVIFLTPFYRGETAKMKVTATAAGKLDAWIDLNADFDWSDPGEQMAASLPVSAGVNIVSFVVPGTAAKGVTYTRFRLSTAGGLTPAGLADDGEVEDYAVTIGDRFPPVVGPKWVQPPDLAYGIDIPSWLYVQKGYEPYLVADDWWCDGRPIDAIRWWGSYLGYGGESNAPAIPVDGIRPSGFRLHWYTDVPAADSQTGYSMPGAELLSRDAPLLSYAQPLDSAGAVKEFYAGTVDLSFLGPNYAGVKEHKFRYDLYLEDSWNEKAGRVYWLGIEALYNSGGPSLFPWGWATTPYLHNWNDDAVVRTNLMTGVSVWGEMTYLPKVPPYATPDQHPYLGRSVNMAYQLLSRVTPRRAYIWRAPPDMVYGTDLDSWRYEPPQPGVFPTRADDWVAEGRHVSDVHWWGSYINWMHDHVGSELTPVPPPVGIGSPLGFNLSWHADGLMEPGAVITNLFVPLEYCHQTYYCCVTQFWQGAGVYEHEYQYYVDLLDPRVSGVPWNVVANNRYWLDIQALFGPGFLPGQSGHAGWGWKTTPEIQGNPSVVATNSLPFWWDVGRYPFRHPKAPNPADLAFELTTDQVGTNRWHVAPNIVAIVMPTNTTSTVLVASVGDVLAGEQQLRMETDLTNATFRTTVDCRPVPFPPPATNWFITTVATNLWEFYRVYQLNP